MSHLMDLFPVSGRLRPYTRARTCAPTHTGATRCLAQPPRGGTTSTSHQHPLIRAPCITAPAHTASLVSDHTRVSHAHARPLHPAALAFVPYGIVLVRVRVRPNTTRTRLHVPAATPPPRLPTGLRNETRARFYPQHWLLCHMGLYLFEFEFPSLTPSLPPYLPNSPRLTVLFGAKFREARG